MKTQDAYNQWAPIYDSNKNRTRDLEGIVLREVLASYDFKTVLEVGCGTGKNTEWLVTKSEYVTSVDFSSEMLAIAKSKVKSENVTFVQANILESWSFANLLYDLVSFSLVLEHIEDLNQIFEKVSRVISPGGYLYIGELHPFKQYSGTKARFTTETDVQTLQCYNHNVSDFIQAAHSNEFSLKSLNEYFDDNDKAQIPRILAIVLQYQGI